VSRNDDPYRITLHRLANSLRPPGFADTFGYFPIGYRLTIWNQKQLLKHLVLKIGHALQVERETEFLDPAAMG